MDIEIVEAKFSDAKEIAKVQTATWLDTYPNQDLGITKKDIKEKLEEKYKDGEQRINEEMKVPNSNTWIAKVDGEVVGFAAISKEGDLDWIEALHVLPKYQGKGIGTKLIQKGLDFIGNKKVGLEVVAYNQKAIDFYKTLGFKNMGEALDDPIILKNGKTIPKISMVKG